MMQTGDMSKDEVFKLRLEEAERKALDAIADADGMTAAQVVRTLIKREAEARAEGNAYRISAWDGMSSTCLFWFGADRSVALAKAKELARTQPQESRWTVFRVYFRDDDEPIETFKRARPKGGA